jgi:hypothetical protein
MLRKRLLTASMAAILSIMVIPPRLWPWGRVGHRASARMAESRLKPQASAAILDLLDGQTLVDAATWAD